MAAPLTSPFDERRTTYDLRSAASRLRTANGLQSQLYERL